MQKKRNVSVSAETEENQKNKKAKSKEAQMTPKYIEESSHTGLTVVSGFFFLSCPMTSFIFLAYSTVTDFAKLRGLSTSKPKSAAVW